MTSFLTETILVTYKGDVRQLHEMSRQTWTATISHVNNCNEHEMTQVSLNDIRLLSTNDHDDTMVSLGDLPEELAIKVAMTNQEVIESVKYERAFSKAEAINHLIEGDILSVTEDGELDTLKSASIIRIMIAEDFLETLKVLTAYVHNDQCIKDAMLEFVQEDESAFEALMDEVASHTFDELTNPEAQGFKHKLEIQVKAGLFTNLKVPLSTVPFR